MIDLLKPLLIPANKQFVTDKDKENFSTA